MQRYSSTYCIIRREDETDCSDLEAMRQHRLFDLEEWNLILNCLDGLPDLPSDCLDSSMVHPDTEIVIEDLDRGGMHQHRRLSQLKPSVVALLADLDYSSIPAYARRWSQHWIFCPFDGVYTDQVREELARWNLDKLTSFLEYFVPLCRTAQGRGAAVYFLWEVQSTFVE